jgi:hypothetical protein
MFGWRWVHVLYFRLWRELCRDQRLYLTNCMERSPSWEATPRMWWNPNFHYHAYKIPTFLLILSQMNPLHVLPFCFFNIDFRIILPCNVCLSLPSHLFTSGFSHENSVRIYCLPPLRVICPLHLSFLIWSPQCWGVPIIMLLIMYFSPSRICTNILLLTRARMSNWFTLSNQKRSFFT